MERLKMKLIKWVSNALGYEVAMIKTVKGDLPKKMPGIFIGGNQKMRKYFDKAGYVLNLQPMKRDYKGTFRDFAPREPLEKVTLSDLYTLGIRVDPFSEEELNYFNEQSQQIKQA
jgi:hypothetical protein